MKKLTTIVAAALLLLSTSAFAKEKKGKDVISKVKTAFARDFSKASETTWKINNGFYIAQFNYNNTVAEAAYNNDGELIGFSKRVKTTDLPLAVTLAIGQKYEGYQVAEKADEVNFEKETSYYVNVGNGKEQLKLKCSVHGDISVDRKIKD